MRGGGGVIVVGEANVVLSSSVAFRQSIIVSKTSVIAKVLTLGNVLFLVLTSAEVLTTNFRITWPILRKIKLQYVTESRQHS